MTINTDTQRNEAIATARANGESIKAVAERFGVSASTVKRVTAARYESSEAVEALGARLDKMIQDAALAAGDEQTAAEQTAVVESIEAERARDIKTEQALVLAVAAEDKVARDAAVLALIDAGYKHREIAPLAQVTKGTVQSIVTKARKGTTRRTGSLREYQKGYQSALADIAAQLAIYGPSVDLVNEWITNNKMAAAEGIFAQALAEHAA